MIGGDTGAAKEVTEGGRSVEQDVLGRALLMTPRGGVQVR